MRITKPVMAVIIVISSIFGRAYAQNDSLMTDPFTFNFLGYLAYQGKIDNGKLKNNSFLVNRSYLTVKKNIYKSLSARLTLDSYPDTNTKGNSLIRIKYFYANFKFDDFLFFTKPNIEAGIVHTPWLDFEEAINTNRMQGTMFMERSGLFSSADFGIGFFTNFGGDMDDNYKKTVNAAYAGRYGSMAFGVYNGGGYSKLENNFVKPFELRLSVRPIPDIIPGLQVSYFGALGTGNLGQDTMPLWTMNAVMLSYESSPLVVTGQYFSGEGNAAGYAKSKTDHSAMPVNGWSVFAMGRYDRWRAIGRYDNYNYNGDITKSVRNEAIVGLGYDFWHNNILILDFDKQYWKDKSIPDANYVKLTMQVNY